jgi:alpha-ketoglutarate-dependent taurine dioxygenase
VIFFRDQDMPPAKFLSFAKRFGEVVEYPFIKGIEGFAEIIPMIKLEHGKHNFGGIWHSDTPFVNIYLAYETLSDGMKRVLDGMIAINSSAKAEVSPTREDRVRDSAKPEGKNEYVGEHPVVGTRPETGRQALYINISMSRTRCDSRT